MGRKWTGARILGPYRQRGGYLVIEVLPNRERAYSMWATETKANAFIRSMRAKISSTTHDTETALDAYAGHLASTGARPASIKTSQWAVRLFYPEPTPLDAITPKNASARYDDLRKVKRKSTGKPLAADTHRGALTRLKTFLTWCVEQKWIAVNPYANVSGIGKKRPRGMSLGKAGVELRIADARTFYSKAVELGMAGNQRAIGALTALLLGMRAGEIVARRVRDLDADQREGDVLWIPDSKTPAGRRTLEVPDPLREMLVACARGRAGDAPLLALADGRAHDSKWVRDSVHYVCDHAGVPRYTAHAMRGGLATIASERGAMGRLIAEQLGHTSYEGMTAKHYAAPGSKRTGVNRRGLTVLQGGRRAAK